MCWPASTTTPPRADRSINGRLEALRRTRADSATLTHYQPRSLLHCGDPIQQIEALQNPEDPTKPDYTNDDGGAPVGDPYASGVAVQVEQVVYLHRSTAPNHARRTSAIWCSAP